MLPKSHNDLLCWAGSSLCQVIYAYGDGSLERSILYSSSDKFSSEPKKMHMACHLKISWSKAESNERFLRIDCC
jgi:hypothetical protein